MSHSNQTTNYQLSQFTGTDKPAWLADYNQDMSKIDTAMKTNATSAATAAASATAADAKADDAQTSAAQALTAAETAQTTANGAQTTATNASQKADRSINNFVFNNFTNNVAATSTGITGFKRSGLTVATNSNGSAGKVFGFMSGTVSSSVKSEITFPTDFRPTTSITIAGAGMYAVYRDNGTCDFQPVNLVIDPDGTAHINILTAYNGRFFVVMLWNCLYVMDAFGNDPIINPTE